jgi:(S)-ureidoglycine aminohydrolase
MNPFGVTRASHQPDHLLQTPDTFVRAPLPGTLNATAIVHIAPARGAAFTAYTVELGSEGLFVPGPGQVFVYVLEGKIQTGKANLSANQYAWFPPGKLKSAASKTGARAIVFEKYLKGSAPKSFSGDEKSVTPDPLGAADSGLEVRALFPDDPTHDFVVNTMTYRPGATLPMVEIHMFEHGLLMLQGEGVYRLGDRWYPVASGDFIWMAPFCPQWFGALGRKPAKYLIYKDWNRHPLQT